MASSKQKGKKKKEVTVTWQEFMKDSVSNAPVVSSWADEMENQNPDEEPEVIVHVNRAALPTAPRAVRGADIDESKVPNQPPFQAYIGNLPFEITEDDIKRFFKNLSVVNVKLQIDNVGRPRGFGYVEFETRQMLIESLAFSDLTIRNRSIRVDLATQSQGGERDNRERRDDFHKRDDGEDRTLNDWRRKDDRASSDRSFRKDDRGGEYDGRVGGGQRGYNRSNYGERRDNDGFDRNRGFGGRQQNFRDGFQGREGYQNRDRYERRDDRVESHGNRGFDRRRDYENRDFERKSEAREEGWRQGGRIEGARDSSWRRDGSKDGPRQPMANRRRDDDEKDEVERKSAEASAPKERPRLNLMPRSKPIEETQQNIATSSIFGGARPVDTSQREREIEEKLKKLHTQRSSEDERKVSQTSDDTLQRRKKPDESQQTKKDKPIPQRVKKDSEECDEPQQITTPVQPPTTVKVVPAPAPKVNFWEARKNNQTQLGTVTANISKEVVRPETEVCRDSDDSALVRDNRVSSTTGDDEFEIHTELAEEDVKTVAKVPTTTKDARPEPPKGNVWESKTKERELKQKPEKEADKVVRRTAVSVGNAMKGRGSSTNRGPNRRDEPVTAVVSVKQKQRERQVPTSIEDMPKLEDRSKKDWSVKNKFSSLMDDDDDDDDDDTVRDDDGDDEVDGADVNTSNNHNNGSKRVSGYKKTEIQECA